MMKKIILGCLIASPLTLFAADESCPQAIDVVVALDSSGSLKSEYGDTFEGWNFEIDRAKDIIDLHDVGFGKTNVAITNSSGCGSNHTYVDCLDNLGRFITEQALSDDPIGTSGLLTYDQADENSGLGVAEFLGGTSWTDWSLYYAKEQLAGSNQIDPRQVIILFSDKEPYPASHKLCDEEGYKSDSLQAVEAAGIDLFIVKLDDANQSDACAVPESDHVNIRGDFTAWSEFLTHYQSRITANPDNDALCGDADVCPNDAVNDYDSDSICGDLDGDDDNDGVSDEVDACSLGVIGSGDAPMGVDIDGDGCVAAEDDDDDGDGINDEDDANPEISIGGLTDADGDGSPDNCSEEDCLGMQEDDFVDGAVDIEPDIEPVDDVESVDDAEPVSDIEASNESKSKSGGALSIFSIIMLLMLAVFNRGSVYRGCALSAKQFNGYSC